MAVAQTREQPFGQFGEGFVGQIIDVMIFRDDHGVALRAVDLQDGWPFLQKRIVVLIGTIDGFRGGARFFMEKTSAGRPT